MDALEKVLFDQAVLAGRLLALNVAFCTKRIDWDDWQARRSEIAELAVALDARERALREGG